MHPLDALIWTALNTRQAAFSEGGPPARRFRAEIGPFAAAGDASAAALAALAALIPKGSDISLLQPAPPAPPMGVQCAMNAPCVQMLAAAFTADARVFSIDALGEADAEEMLDLAALTKPGPFRAKTHTLGRFLGVRDGGRLIAMAGERLQIEGFTEISAVCTHPDYRGRGLGAALIRAVGARILSEGATPFLHSYAGNEAALALYRKLGFETRREVTHAIWRRSA